MERARSGRVNAAMVLLYLSGLRYLVEQTSRLFVLAAERADEKNDLALSEHYRSKAQEERGHHLWAESDMAGISKAFEGLGSPEPSRALAELVAFLKLDIDASPVRYLGYALLAEYVTVAVGPDWLRALEQNCGISVEHLTVVANHVELDGEHVSEGLAEIDALTPPAELVGMRTTIRTSIEHLDAFLSELLCLPEAA